jgi:type I restriction enzyme S subunit
MRSHYDRPRLDDIVIIHNGRGLPLTKRDAAGEHTVYASGGAVGRHSASITQEPFVVIGRKGSAGKPTCAPHGGWVIDTAYYAQPKDSSHLDSKFLFYAVSSLNFTELFACGGFQQGLVRAELLISEARRAEFAEMLL